MYTHTHTLSGELCWPRGQGKAQLGAGCFWRSAECVQAEGARPAALSYGQAAGLPAPSAPTITACVFGLDGSDRSAHWVMAFLPRGLMENVVIQRVLGDELHQLWVTPEPAARAYKTPHTAPVSWINPASSPESHTYVNEWFCAFTW